MGKAVQLEIEGITIPSNGQDKPGLCLSCTKCDHQVRVQGEGEGSKKYGFVLMRDQCPNGEENYYTDDEGGDL